MSEQEWKPIPGYEGNYEASIYGKIRSVTREVTYNCKKSTYVRVKPGKVLSPADSRGYKSVPLHADNQFKRFYVHQLVALTFLGPTPDGMEVSHKNNNRGDNRASNLAYTSHQDNMADKYKHGTVPIGSRVHNALLDDEKIREIRNSTAPSKTLALAYGVHPHHINRVKAGKAWKHVQ